MKTLFRDSSRYDSDVDIMRIVAAFFVIMIHSSDLNSFSGCIYNSIARFSVPVFVIISGYYMLDRRIDTKSIIYKCCKLLLTMIVFSNVFYFYYIISGIQKYTGIKDYLTFIITQPIHLWYIYAIVTLYIFTPALYVFSSNASKQEYLYVLCLTFFFGSVVLILLRSGVAPIVSTIIDKMKIPYTLGFVFLYLFGGYLKKYWIEKRNRNLIYILGLLGTLITAGYTAATKSELLLSFFAPNVQVAGIAFFVFTKQYYGKRRIKSDSSKNIIHLLAKSTLIVYMLHPLFISLLKDKLNFKDCFAILLKTALVFLVSLSVSCAINLCGNIADRKR